MEEGRLKPKARDKQIIQVKLSNASFLKDLKLGDTGFIRANGEIIKERVNERPDKVDTISKLIQINKISPVEKSRRM
jgi:hypothetical protein